MIVASQFLVAQCVAIHVKIYGASERGIELPSREELKGLIRTTAFTTIGARYRVSDNAVRRWCDKYNLPRKVKDIKSYSDKEWELI